MARLLRWSTRVLALGTAVVALAGCRHLPHLPSGGNDQTPSSGASARADDVRVLHLAGAWADPHGTEMYIYANNHADRRRPRTAPATGECIVMDLKVSPSQPYTGTQRFYATTGTPDTRLGSCGALLATAQVSIAMSDNDGRATFTYTSVEGTCDSCITTVWTRTDDGPHVLHRDWYSGTWV